MTGHNIVYGFDRQEFKTTNNQNYNPCDLSGKAEAQRLLEERSKNLKRSNFHFGHDDEYKHMNQPQGEPEHLQVGSSFGGQKAKEVAL